MQNIAHNVSADLTTTDSVESSAFTGEGVELFGCYAERAANSFTGTGSELFGCYNARKTVEVASGDGAELFGCYKA